MEKQIAWYIVGRGAHASWIEAVVAVLSAEKRAVACIERFRADIVPTIGWIVIEPDERMVKDFEAVTPVLQMGGSTRIKQARYFDLPPDWSVFKETILLLQNQSAATTGFHPMIVDRLLGQSQSIQNVMTLVSKLERSDVNVLITGESGTGKEVVAKLIHELSDRKHQPFVPVNCGAIPQELLESELFGHEKGAFTGAIQQRIGRFELANGGTLFLDEIGDMPLDMQVKILRVLQEQAFERVGGNKTIRVDVRIIAATHRHLEKAIEAGSFREDLYYRLNVFPIHMPKLADRVEDIPALIAQMTQELAERKQITLRFSQMAIESLKQYTWPGNIRELKNLLERLSVLFPERTILLSDLPARYQTITLPQAEECDSSHVVLSETAPDIDMGNFSKPPRFNQQFNLKVYLNDLERTYILSALNQHQGIVAHAAKQLGLQRTTLIEKIKKYQIDRD